jgi:hypothetical protein
VLGLKGRLILQRLLRTRNARVGIRNEHAIVLALRASEGKKIVVTHHVRVGSNFEPHVWTDKRRMWRVVSFTVFVILLHVFPGPAHEGGFQCRVGRHLETWSTLKVRIRANTRASTAIATSLIGHSNLRRHKQ